MKMNSTPPLILASNSPRRKAILEEMGYTFSASAASVEEKYPPQMAADSVAEFLASWKNDYHRSAFNKGEVILTADTTVLADGNILGKPASSEEAIHMIKQLSSSSHRVITGVAISSDKKKVVFSDNTIVQFTALEPSEIQYYVDRFKPLDKAGAYGIQEWIGMIGITSITGSYYNVVGLPTEKVYHQLKTNFGITPLQ